MNLGIFQRIMIDYITGYTWMDNFDMSEFFDKIGVNGRNVNWSEYPFNLPEDLSGSIDEETNEDSDWRKLLYED